MGYNQNQMEHGIYNQIADMPIITTTGWKKLNDVVTGDYVFDERGVPTEVIFCRTAPEPVYRVVLNKYVNMVVPGSWGFLTLTNKERSANLKRTPEYRDKRRANRKDKKIPKTNRRRPDLSNRNQNRVVDHLEHTSYSFRDFNEIALTLRDGRTKQNHSLSIHQQLVFPENGDLLINPYVLGVWLGDGNSKDSSYTNNDPEIAQRIRNMGYSVKETPYTDRNASLFRIEGLLGDLKEIGVLGNKHIPENYLRSSFENRIELLRGILDTDGYVDQRGSISFSLSHRPLALGTVELIRSLGIKCNIRQRKAKLYGVEKKDRFRMDFFTNLDVFSLSRHVDRLNSLDCDSRSKIRRTIWYVDECNLGEVQEINHIKVAGNMILFGEHLVPVATS